MTETITDPSRMSPTMLIEVPIERARVKYDDAAGIMGINTRTLERLIDDYDLFSIIRDGDGPGFHRFLMYDEIRLYVAEVAKSDAIVARSAVREYRRKAGRLKDSKPAKK